MFIVVVFGGGDCWTGDYGDNMGDGVADFVTEGVGGVDGEVVDVGVASDVVF